MEAIRRGLLVLAVLAAAASAWAQTTSTRFSVYVRGRDAGSETVTVTRTPQGWTVAGSGRMSAPVDLSTGSFEMRYDADWKPVSLSMESLTGGRAAAVQLMFQEGMATGQVKQATDIAPYTYAVPSDAVVLTDSFFGAYEALAARLAGVTGTAEIPCFFVRQSVVMARVTASTDERIQTPSRTIPARRHRFTLIVSPAPIEAELWADENNRLLRLSVPWSGLDVVREDIATVAMRRQTVTRAGDEQVRIAAAGFTLGATISKPSTPPPARGYPAIVLVPGSGPQDRDEVRSEVPVFGHLANQLADAGFLVARYDKRAVGLSGGRAESVGVGDYAEDARAVVKFLEKRRDVDDDRVTVLGYGDGGWTALLAASREGDIDSIVLVATPGVSGSDLVLAQQQEALARMNIPEQEKQAKIELQKKINAAVISGTGWGALPAEMRQQADTPWFQSFLAFDPAEVMKRVKQPLLVVHAELDREVTAAHAERLTQLGRARKDRRTDAATVPGVNHLLAAAATGSEAEYPELKEKAVSPAVSNVIAEWLKAVPES
jgi:pimeloyl-ACP methyl ester carboxylesterase